MAAHRITDVDPLARTGTCAVCGPGSSVRPRRRGGQVSYWACRRPDQPRRAPGAKVRQRLRDRYGLTPEDYAELVATHGDGCAICGRAPVGRRLDIDHCHRSLQVRGLLCSSCNRGLGLFGDDPERLAAAIRYLTRAAERPGTD